MKEFIEFVETRIEPTDAKEDVKKEESSKKGTSATIRTLKMAKPRTRSLENSNSFVNNMVIIIPMFTQKVTVLVREPILYE